ncbi:MAG TPA: ADP-ribosyltransferase [Acidimicrobiales bacterium]|nr:ADP-ribosyltransferase [Acidimicrobiales bacterium]HVC99838.1 ADP-ribosyltransferase [Candidatus Dormibacteraeota bacterium]
MTARSVGADEECHCRFESLQPAAVTERADDRAERLTQEVRRAVLPITTDAELAALRRYQALDRTYELVNQFLRGERQAEDLSAVEAAEVRSIVMGLSELLKRWRTPEPLVVYRGLRSRTGLPLDPNLEAASFLSTTIARDVALAEFTVPSGPGGPVLLEISVPAGTPGVWAPALGDPALAYQGELLLGRGVQLAVRDRRDEAGILVLDCEVEP